MLTYFPLLCIREEVRTTIPLQCMLEVHSAPCLSMTGVSIAHSSFTNYVPQDATSILNVKDTKPDESVFSVFSPISIRFA